MEGSGGRLRLPTNYIGGGGQGDACISLQTTSVEGARGTLASPYIIGLNGNDLEPALDMFNGFSMGIGKWLISFK